MANDQRRNRLSAILFPSTLFAKSHVRSLSVSSDSVQISHGEDSRPKRVKNQRRSLQLFSFPPTSPLLSGPAATYRPLSALETSGGLEPLMSHPPRERPPRKRPLCVENPSTPRSSHSSNRPSNEGTRRRGQAMEPPRSRRPSVDSYLPTPAVSPDLQSYPRTSRNRLKRRASVNVIPTPNQITLVGSAEPKQLTVSRTRSLRTSKNGLSTIRDDAQHEETHLRGVNPLPDALAEKQRVINVRRARKMQQVFGSEPPQALFQATRINLESDEECRQTQKFDKRSSASTLLSISTANLLSPQPISGRQRTLSVSSTIMVPTPPMTPTTPVPPQLETPAGVLPRLERSFTHNPPTTPPPFSNMFHPDTRTPDAVPGASRSIARANTTGRGKEKDFRQRRVRAAKLAKFFGVGYHDLEPHLVPEGRTNVRKLEVAIDDGGGLFWDKHELRSLEMEDVIVRLRDLRSS